MAVLRYALALAVAGLAPVSAQAAAHCVVEPDSVRDHPAMLGPAGSGYPAPLEPAHEMRVRVTVAADGSPTDVVVEGSEGDPESTRLSALKWRYRCEGKQGGVAEWVVQYAAQQCRLNLTSKNWHPPRYPPEAFRAEIQGAVLLALQPQGDGQTARRAYVANSSGSDVLDQAALAAGNRWTFDCEQPIDASEPAQRIPVHFALN